MQTRPRRAALFDLDRTLVRVNTGTLYVRWQIRRGEARRRDLARLFWWLTRYAAGSLDAEAIARTAVRKMRGRHESEFLSAATEWVRQEVLPHVSDRAVAELERRRREGYVLAILTSSTPYVAGPLAAHLGIDHVLASRLEVENGVFTGGLVSPFCYREGKVVAATSWAQEHDVDLAQSVFFTDSISDLPMLEAVGEPFVVNPDPRLRWRAWRRGWPVERW